MLYGLFVGLQEVHGTVELVQLELLSAFNVNIFLEPLLMAVEFGDRGAGAVGYQGEQGTFDVEAKMT